MTPSDEVKSYRDLLVWKAGMQLAVSCYRITGKFPRYELFGLTAQMRRAAVSIPSNLAEGHNRSHRKEFLQFVSVAKGSLGELETQMTLAVHIGYLEATEVAPFFAGCEELGKMLTGLKHSLTLSSH